MATIVMDADGRLTVPEEAREALGLDGATTLEVVVEERDGLILLRPIEDYAADDEWLYEPATVDRLVKARIASESGPLHHLSTQDLDRIAQGMDDGARLHDD